MFRAVNPTPTRNRFLAASDVDAAQPMSVVGGLVFSGKEKRGTETSIPDCCCRNKWDFRSLSVPDISQTYQFILSSDSRAPKEEAHES